MAERVVRVDRSRWLRRAGAALTVLAVAAAGTYAANAASQGASPRDRYRTVLAANGSIEQRLPVTGTVQRVTQVAASFPVSGTVTAVSVAVGDPVQAGQAIAAIDAAPLQLAVLDAQAQVALAQAALETDSQPASTTAGSPGGSAGSAIHSAAPAPTGSAPRSAQGDGAAAPTASAPRSAQGGGMTATAKGGARGGTDDLEQLLRGIGDALQAQQTACRPVLGDRQGVAPPAPRASSPSEQPARSATPTTTPSAPPSTTSSTPQTTSTTTPSTGPTTASPTTSTTTPSTGPTTTSPTTSTTTPSTTTASTGPTTASPTTSTTSTSTAPTTPPTSTTNPVASRTPPPATDSSTTDPRPAGGPGSVQLAACVAAVRTLATAERSASAALTAYASSLSARSASGSSPGGSGGASSPGTRAGTGGTGTPATSGAARQQAEADPAAPASGVNEIRVMNDQTALTTAMQNLTKAREHLGAATLTAPISGVVGSIGFAVGSAESPSNSITIVGAGAAEVSSEVPLVNLPSVEIGQTALVTPAGATESVVGSVTRVNLLPTTVTSTTAGPTYAVVTLVPQASQGLTTGSRAEVGIVVDHVDNVLTVPVSAVTAVATGTAVVQVLKDGTATRATVQTGAVGQGQVQVLGGLTAGQVLVIADLTQPLPDNSTQNLRRVTGTGGVGGGGLGGPGGPGGGGAPRAPGGGGAAGPGG